MVAAGVAFSAGAGAAGIVEPRRCVRSAVIVAAYLVILFASHLTLLHNGLFGRAVFQDFNTSARLSSRGSVWTARAHPAGRMHSQRHDENRSDVLLPETRTACVEGTATYREPMTLDDDSVSRIR